MLSADRLESGDRVCSSTRVAERLVLFSGSTAKKRHTLPSAGGSSITGRLARSPLMELSETPSVIQTSPRPCAVAPTIDPGGPSIATIDFPFSSKPVTTRRVFAIRSEEQLQS